MLHSVVGVSQCGGYFTVWVVHSVELHSVVGISHCRYFTVCWIFHSVVDISQYGGYFTLEVFHSVVDFSQCVEGVSQWIFSQCVWGVSQCGFFTVCMGCFTVWLSFIPWWAFHIVKIFSVKLERFNSVNGVATL